MEKEEEWGRGVCWNGDLLESGGGDDEKMGFLAHRLLMNLLILAIRLKRRPRWLRAWPELSRRLPNRTL